MNESKDFMRQVPEALLQKTEMHLCDSIIIFKPAFYIGGITFDITDYHIVIPSETTPEILINNKPVRGEDGKILAINPGDSVACIRHAPAKPYRSFLLRPKLLQKIAAEIGFDAEPRFESFLNNFSFELIDSFNRLEREAARRDRSNLMLDSLEVQIAVLLLRELKTNVKPASRNLQDADSYVGMAQEYIRTYFSSNISLRDICREIHVSPFHFIRTFMKKTGMTPHKYLLSVRMEKAKELLMAGRHSVAETAMLCGYNSISNFSVAFKNTVGISPSDYKRQ